MIQITINQRKSSGGKPSLDIRTYCATSHELRSEIGVLVTAAIEDIKAKYYGLNSTQEGRQEIAQDIIEKIEAAEIKIPEVPKTALTVMLSEVEKDEIEVNIVEEKEDAKSAFNLKNLGKTRRGPNSKSV